jgi:uncharacterized phage-associated protein
MHSALAIANYFIQAARAGGLSNKDFPPAKVHGLVYLAHGWLLGSAGAPIITGKVAADRDGVFIPELREAGCAGTKNVTELVSVIKMDESRGVMTEQTPQLTPQNATVSALAWIWKTYGPLSSFRITEHIKESGSPWEKVWHDPDRKGDEPQVIPTPLIKSWFRRLSGMRQEQGRHSKLTETQNREKKPRLDETQRLLTATRGGKK